MQSHMAEIKKILIENIESLIQEFPIVLIYVFGSYAKGKNTDTSDLDIAVLFQKGYSPIDKLNLMGEFTSLLHRDDIDLVILNSSNSVLCHQVIKYGRLVYAKDEDSKVNFEVKVLKEYMDMEPFRRVQMEGVRHWIHEKVGEIESD